MSSKSPIDIARALLDALNHGNRSGVHELLAPNVTQHGPPGESPLSGPDAVTESLWAYRNTFPDLRVEITDAFAAGDRGALEVSATGTYEPYTYGAAAKRVAWQGCLIVRSGGGLLVNIDIYADLLSVLSQLDSSPEQQGVRGVGVTRVP